MLPEPKESARNSTKDRAAGYDWGSTRCQREKKHLVPELRLAVVGICKTQLSTGQATEREEGEGSHNLTVRYASFGSGHRELESFRQDGVLGGGAAVKEWVVGSKAGGQVPFPPQSARKPSAWAKPC